MIGAKVLSSLRAADVGGKSDLSNTAEQGGQAGGVGKTSILGICLEQTASVASRFDGEGGFLMHWQDFPQFLVACAPRNLVPAWLPSLMPGPGLSQGKQNVARLSLLSYFQD